MKKILKSIIWIFSIFIVFAIIANIYYHTRSRNKPKQFRDIVAPVQKPEVAKKIARPKGQPKEIQKYEEDIRILKVNSLLTKINPEMNEAFIEPAIWNRLDYDVKQNISRSMAFYCGIKKGTNLNWVDIKDRYSGKKVAKYSEAWGFKVY